MSRDSREVKPIILLYGLLKAYNDKHPITSSLSDEVVRLQYPLEFKKRVVASSVDIKARLVLGVQARKGRRTRIGAVYDNDPGES